ncbi:DUF4123 domain-containing protein [Pseudomonas fluorescens]|uniref:DUF4123 domain-containing protein n=1 Tax=Pseudomonas fluorescens TaxID=294 RepID=A0A5E7AT62_PSEFL|nr:DUF4123 domain-containing protein [Pseudomonas fluorescens]VVN81829.1 hypothetical protein PS704_01171 [Pseudomonas fluorescens]
MKLSTSLPENLPWSEQHAFLLLDGATLSDLPQRLKTLSPGASILALYDSTPFNALRDISPMLVAMEQPDADFFSSLCNARRKNGACCCSAPNRRMRWRSTCANC